MTLISKENGLRAMTLGFLSGAQLTILLLLTMLYLTRIGAISVPMLEIESSFKVVLGFIDLVLGFSSGMAAIKPVLL